MITIDNFWSKKISTTLPPNSRLVKGWSVVTAGLSTFLEAPLLPSSEAFSEDSEPDDAEIILVSAPGAVGKSTLAREIAFRTGAVYVDLAEADAVGGNTLSGGLARSGIFDAWLKGGATVLIDGLDEARLRVTQDSYRAFLDDIAEMAKGREVPVVLFGRTGAIQETWIILDEHEVSCSVLEIGFYDIDSSVEFAVKSLEYERPGSSHSRKEREAISLILSSLRTETHSDGDRFAGYAPVLQAVAKRVEKEGNPEAIISSVKAGGRPVTLLTVAEGIMDRERVKLLKLKFEDDSLYEKLYSSKEQLDRLVSMRYGNPIPTLPKMAPNDEKAYVDALETWVSDHPFMKTGTREPSSSVFDGLIATHALKSEGAESAAIRRELERGAAANPFLAEFYFEEDEDAAGCIPSGHIGAIYASVRSRLSLKDSASLVISSERDQAGDDEAHLADVEIAVFRGDAVDGRTKRFVTDQTEPLNLPPHIEDVEISAPFLDVKVGPASEIVFVSPVSIQCERITISARRIVVEAAAGEYGEGGVFLEAHRADTYDLSAIPIIRGNVNLSASWPGVRAHPWTSFATEPTVDTDPVVYEGLRRFRKFIIAFRSHSKGSLARFRDKLEHERMTKGAGQAIFDALIGEGVVKLIGRMYHLDPVLLKEVTGATYQQCMSANFSPQTVGYVRSIVSR